MEHSLLAICEEGMLFPVTCLMRGGVPLGVLLSDEISEERRKEGKIWWRMRFEYRVVSMRTEPPSLCLGCGRAACKGCVTLGVDRRRQF